MSALDLLLGLVGLLLSLMVYSFLAGEKIYFRLALVILAALSSAYAAAVLISKVILPFFAQGFSAARSIIPALLGFILILPLLTVMFKFRSRSSQLSLAVLGGSLASLTILGTVRGTLLPQALAIVDSFSLQNLAAGGDPSWTHIVEALAMLVGVVSVLFLFQHQQLEKNRQLPANAFLLALSKIGQVFVGIVFGALFVGMYSSALRALIANLSSIKAFFEGLL